MTNKNTVFKLHTTEEGGRGVIGGGPVTVESG